MRRKKPERAFDPEAKRWYIPEGKDPSVFAQWADRGQQAPEGRTRQATPAEIKPAAAPVQDRAQAVPEAKAEAQPGKVYIAVSYAEKDEAKALGAKWDRKAKSWYVAEGTDMTPFEKWAVGSGKAQEQTNELSPRAEFTDFLKAQGLLLTDIPVMDGHWHRVMVEGDRKGQFSGSYRGFLDGRPSGQATNWKAGKNAVPWIATGVTISDEDRAQIKAQAAAVAAKRAADLQQVHKEAARKAYGVWSNLTVPATPENCPYLAAKGVEGHGTMIDKEGHLVVPMRDEGGRLWGCQFVQPGSKHYIKGSRKQGTMHVLEPSGKGTLDAITPGMGGTIIVATGYATGSTIYEATGRPVVLAFDDGNLETVVQAIRATHPQQILIAADNDHANKHGNVGIEKAEEAARTVSAAVLFPEFTAAEKAAKLTDWNDFAKVHGKEAVRDIFENSLSQHCSAGLERGVA